MIAAIFSLFLGFCQCESLRLTSKNYSEVINNEEGIPVFLKAWATWCPHCKEMAPIWDQLANETKYEGKVIFADIECESNRDICKNLPGANFPRIYWIEEKRNKTFIKYENERTLSSFENFIHKQFSFPLELANPEDIEEILNKAKKLPTFVFTIDQDDTNSLAIAKSALQGQRNSSNFFILLKGEKGSKPSLTCYSGSKDVVFNYDGEWEHESLKNFVILKTIRFLRPVDGYVMRFADNNLKKTFIVVQEKDTDVVGEVREKALRANELYVVGKTDCTDGMWFCKYTNIHPTNENPVYVIYARYEKLFWIYNNETDFDAWLNDVYHENIKGEGPGTGWLNSFKKMYYDARAEGRAPPIFLFMIPIIFAILIFLMFCDPLDARPSKETSPSKSEGKTENEKAKTD